MDGVRRSVGYLGADHHAARVIVINDNLAADARGLIHQSFAPRFLPLFCALSSITPSEPQLCAR